jgi:hypothetical protein
MGVRGQPTKWDKWYSRARWARKLVGAGGRVSYAAAYEELYRRGAKYIDKILRGTKLADIPVEQPTKFDLVLNLTTTIRDVFLLRARRDHRMRRLLFPLMVHILELPEGSDDVRS